MTFCGPNCGASVNSDTRKQNESSPGRWRFLEELYRAAVEHPAGERAAFLQEACPDEDLRREVESLLRFEGRGDTLMQQSPWTRSRGVAPGMRLGLYEVESRLGAGRRGEVWKAPDTRLRRSVAVKVSKTEFSERFEREARAVAALNHPNIAALYDVGQNYFVMEYVDGKSRQEVIPRKGLSVGESLKFFVWRALLRDAPGTREFRADSAAATLAEILTKDPLPIGNLPGDVEKLLNRCLRKEPTRRAQSMVPSDGTSPSPAGDAGVGPPCLCLV